MPPAPSGRRSSYFSSTIAPGAYAIRRPETGPEPSGEGSSKMTPGPDIAGGGRLATVRISVVERGAPAAPPAGGGVEAPVGRCPGWRVINLKSSADALMA